MTDAFSSPPYPPPYPPQYQPPHPKPHHHTPLGQHHTPLAHHHSPLATHDSPPGHHSDLRVLRSAYRRQRRVATLTALGYFLLFLVLSAFAPSFMTGTVTGGLSTGLLLGLIQLPVTCLAIWLYEHTARRRVDPLADRIRHLAEADARRDAKRQVTRGATL